MASRPQISEVLHSGYGVASSTNLVTPASGLHLLIWGIEAQNGSGAAADVGLMLKNTIQNPGMYFGQIDDSEATDFQDQTTALRAGTEVNIFTTDTDDGFMVQYKEKFGFIGLNLATANTGGVFVYEYWNGSAFTTLTTHAVPAYTSTGWVGIAFAPPIDWATGDDVGGNSNQYSIKVTASTAPNGVIGADNLFIGKWIAFHQDLAGGGSLSVTFKQDKPLLLEGGESIVPYFGTTSANNTATVTYTNV